jgi:hypothetical protein
MQNSESLLSTFNAYEKGYPLHLDTRQAAEILGMSSSWLVQLRRKGGGPVFRKFGRKVKYYVLDLVEWLDNRPQLGKKEETKENI